MADKGGVLVVAETIDGALAPSSAELVGAGTRLAEGLGCTASALLLGSGLDAAASSLAALGPIRTRSSVWASAARQAARRRGWTWRATPRPTS